MKKIICISLAVFCFNLILTSQIYTHPDFDSLTKNHKVLAILPFEVTLRLKAKKMKKLEPEDLEKLEIAEGKAVQNSLHTYFLKQKDSFKVSFQDISKTNALLAGTGWSIDSLRSKNKFKICRQLQVDGIITGSIMTKKLMSDEAAAILLGLGLLVGSLEGGPTNSGNCIIKLYEAKAGELLWKYENALSRGLGSDTQSVINDLMRKALKNFPYEDIK